MHSRWRTKTREQQREATRRRDRTLALAFRPTIARLLEGERRRYLAAVDDSVDDPAEFRNAILDAYRPELWVAGLTTVWIGEPVSDVFYDTIKELGGEPRDLPVEVQRTFARYAARHARSIATTNRDRVLALPEEKSREFRSTMRRGLRELYSDVAGRSDHLAFVEGLQAGESARYEAAVDVAVSERYQFRKVWFTMGDDRVRDTHAAVNGQSRVVRQKRGGAEGLFTVGGAKLRYPRDPAGPSGEIIGCRCFLEYRRVRR